MLDGAAGDDLRTIEATVLDGMAKPMPSLPPDSLLICVLTPTTWPAVFRSGPPELPWLMAASVWIEFEIVKLFWGGHLPVEGADDAARGGALEPEGLPSATTPSPTRELGGVAEPSGFRIEAGASTLMTARSVEGRCRRRSRRRSSRPRSGRDLLGALDDVVVRDDVAVGVEDEAGALALRLLLAAQRRGLARRGRDLDDALVGLLVDLADGQRLVVDAAGCALPTVTWRTTVPPSFEPRAGTSPPHRPRRRLRRQRALR